MPRAKHPSEQIVWSEELREKIPDIPNVDFRTDGRPDPIKVAAIMRKSDTTIRSKFNQQKRLATVAWHLGWGAGGADEDPYSIPMLCEWFAKNYDYYPEKTDIRMGIVIMEATGFYGDTVGSWIDSFPASTQHEIARQALYVLKKNPVLMDEPELEKSREVMEAIMRAVPRGTVHANVKIKLQNAGLLPAAPLKPLGKVKADEEPEFDIDAEILKRLRLSEDGMIAGMYFPRFVKGPEHMEQELRQEVELVMTTHEGITRDQALRLLVDAGIKALGLGKKDAA